MDWNAAIERNGRALKRILAMLVAMAAPACRAGRPQSGPPCRAISTARYSPCCVRPKRPRGGWSSWPRVVLPRRRRRARKRPCPRRRARPGPNPGRSSSTTARAPGLSCPPAYGPGRSCRASPRRVRRHGHSRFHCSIRCAGSRTTGVRSAACRASRRPASRDRGSDRRPLSPDDPIDATRLALRLQAVGRALDDLPAHARRFARWRARRDAAGAQNKKGRGAGLHRRVWPLRPGRPPGSLPTGRRRSAHEVHEVLADLHSFAFSALERRDSS